MIVRTEIMPSQKHFPREASRGIVLHVRCPPRPLQSASLITNIQFNIFLRSFMGVIGKQSRPANSQGQILTEWTLAAKLPNSDLNFAVDFWVHFFPRVFSPRKKARIKSTKKSPAKFTQGFVRKNSPRISAETFS